MGIMENKMETNLNLVIPVCWTSRQVRAEGSELQYSFDIGTSPICSITPKGKSSLRLCSQEPATRTCH